MNKQEFLKKLKYELRKLKKDERKKYIDYYDEIILDIMDKGVSEEEAIKRQGNVAEIAKEILSSTNPSSLILREWRGITLSVISVFMLLICIIPTIMKSQFYFQMNSSMGIIGGADGPTSVFIAGKVGTPWGLYIATAVVVVVTIIYWVRKYKRL